MNHFIVNPNAGKRNKSQFVFIIGLIKRNPKNHIWITQMANQSAELTQKALLSGATKIIAVGGDGTINEVASVLVGSNIPLGIIPVGSGNGLARHLSIPLNPELAYYHSITENLQQIDVGFINNRHFFCTAGIGFDAQVAHRFAYGKNRGFLNYVKATFFTLIQYTPIYLKINDGAEEKVFSITFANANQFGNNAFISPFSNIQDGLLEIVKIKPVHLLQAIEIGIRLFGKTVQTVSKVSISSCENIQISCPLNTPIHLDGENLFTQSEKLAIGILPKALNVVC